jgi:glyoxylase I family protein
VGFEVRGVTVLLGVDDIRKSVNFYRDKLGFEVVQTSPVMSEDYFHWALLRRGDALLMLNTNFEFEEQRPAEIDSVRIGAHGDVCLYFGCPDVNAAYEELRGKGVAVAKPVVTNYGMKQMYVDDPDGYKLCFQWAAKD